MKEYILAVICITLIGSIASLLVPDGEGGGISKTFRVIYGVCIVLVCVNPIKSMISYIKEVEIPPIVEIGENNYDRYEGIFNSTYEGFEEQNLKNGIKSILKDKFSIDESEMSISLTFTQDSEMGGVEGMIGSRTLERVCITLYGSAMFANTGEIEEYLWELLSCEIITVIG